MIDAVLWFLLFAALGFALTTVIARGFWIHKEQRRSLRMWDANTRRLREKWEEEDARRQREWDEEDALWQERWIRRAERAEQRARLADEERQRLLRESNRDA